MTTLPNEACIGDNVYVRFDGYAFELRASRYGSDHYVVLEPITLRHFIDFAEAMGFRRSKKTPKVKLR